jgi:L-iditol 2-dehydrogenase
MGKMRAAHAVKLKTIVCKKVEVPHVTDNRVLVKTKLSSICGSDLHVVNMGYTAYASDFPLPYGAPGHEGVGEIIESRSPDFSEGESVLTVPNIYSSKTFADYQVIEPKYLVKLPPNGNANKLMMAQQLATVEYSCKHIDSIEGKTVAVIGQGSAGLFHNFILKRYGAEKIIAIEPIDHRRNISKDFGADVTIDFTGQKATDAILDMTNGAGVDIAIEAVGSAETLNQAMSICKPQGRVQSFGLPTTLKPIPFDWNTFFSKRLTINSNFGSQDEQDLASVKKSIDLINKNDIDMDKILSHEFSIEEIQDAFDFAERRTDGMVKITITF